MKLLITLQKCAHGILSYYLIYKYHDGDHDEGASTKEDKQNKVTEIWKERERERERERGR